MLVLASSWPLWLVGITTVLFLAVCIIMVLTVLIQKPQGGGLASAFGGAGAGSGQTAFGAKTGDALTVFTIIVFVVYLGFAIALNFAMQPTKSVAGATVTPAGGNGPSQPQPADSGPANQPPDQAPASGQTPPSANPPSGDAPKPSDTPAPADTPKPAPGEPQPKP